MRALKMATMSRVLDELSWPDYMRNLPHKLSFRNCSGPRLYGWVKGKKKPVNSYRCLKHPNFCNPGQRTTDLGEEDQHLQEGNEKTWQLFA